MATTTIYKYPLKPISGRQLIQMPAVHSVLCLQVQGNIPCLWAKVNPASPIVDVPFEVRLTGGSLTGQEGRYEGTALLDEGSYVLHVFDG